MQFISPALVGACVSAAAFAMFLAIGPDRAGAPPPPPAETKTSPLANMAILDDSQRAAIEQTVEAELTAR